MKMAIILSTVIMYGAWYLMDPVAMQIMNQFVLTLIKQWSLVL